MSAVHNVESALLHVERGFFDCFAQGRMRMTGAADVFPECFQGRIQLLKPLRRLVPMRGDPRGCGQQMPYTASMLYVIHLAALKQVSLRTGWARRSRSHSRLHLR